MRPSQFIAELKLVCVHWKQRFLMHFADLLPMAHWNYFRKVKNSTYRRLGMRIDEPVFIDVGFKCIRPDNIQIENNVSLGHDNHIWAFFPVRIGHHTFTAKDLLVLAGSHDVGSFVPTDGQEVEIGPGCWIGTRVTILGGAKIGKGCVIGAGSVVRGTIPDFSVAAGVPAKVIRQREPSDPVWNQFASYPLSEIGGPSAL